MPEALSRAEIRRLILKIKYPGGHVVGLARAIAAEAVAAGMLSSTPNFAYSSPEADSLSASILTVCWELVLEGVYSPGGSSVQQPNFGWLQLTDYGKRCFEVGELTPHDPDDYMKRLKDRCPSVDDVTLIYVGESLATFRRGLFLSAVVMIGVAAESMWHPLTESVTAALETPAKQESFSKVVSGAHIKRMHDEVMRRLKDPTARLPQELRQSIEQHLYGIADLTRQTRNSAGHPTGKRIERDEALALLLLFPGYCGTVGKLMDWLGNNTI